MRPEIARALAVAVAVGAAGGCRSEAREATRVADAGQLSATPESCGVVRAGARQRRRGLGGERLLLGVVADAKEPLPATLANLEHVASRFAREHVSAVLALGGLGANEEQIARVLGALRGAGAPVLALPGDREPAAAFHAAVARANRAGLDVVDLSTVRVLEDEAGGLALLSLPGYPYPHYLGAGAAGCRYTPADVEALRALAEGLHGGARILVAHLPPRGVGPDALDWALGGANVGDPDLARLLPSLGVRVAAFAHVDEAGGRATSPSDGGTRPVAEDEWVERLALNVGAIDSVPHPLVGARTSARGQAALIELAAGKARYRVVRP